MTQLRLASHHTTDHRLEYDTPDDEIVTPCYRQVTIEKGPDWWFSDLADERVAAQQICLTECPLITACRAAGEAAQIGVWGGSARGWTETRGRPRARCATCDRPMRPIGATKAAFPGTVARHSRTHCATCGKKEP